MIKLSRLHGAGELVVNADLIETVEAHPDTTVTLLTKRRFVVQEPVEEVIDRIVAFRQRCAATSATPASVRTALVPELRIDAA